MKLTKRGERLFAALLVIAGLVLFAGIVWLSGHIHWVGTHYCFGSFEHCYKF